MKKSDKKSISNSIGSITFLLILIYKEKLTILFPFLNNVYLFVGIAFSFGMITTILIGNLLPQHKKIKNQRNPLPKKAKISTKIIKKKLTDHDILKTDLFTLEGTDFERLCLMYFQDLGFKPESTSASGDHGVDLIIKDPEDGLKIAVQCKRQKNSVGNGELIKLQGGKDFYKCYGTLFITTSSFTSKAREYAETVDMGIWNGLTVKDKIGTWQKGKIKKI